MGSNVIPEAHAAGTHGVLAWRSGARGCWRLGWLGVLSIYASVAGAGSAVLNLGCAAENEEAVHASTANGAQSAVSRLKTFAIVLPDPEELKENNMQPDTLRRLADLSIEAMKDRGYQPAAAANAELLIGLSPGVTLMRPLRVYDQSKTGRSDEALTEHGTGEGRLTVSFVDTRAKQVVLTRVAQTRVSGPLSDSKMRAIISGVFEGMPRAAQ